MGINTLAFLLFFVFGITVFYLLPQRLKWPFLLLLSLSYISFKDIRGIVFIVLSSLSVFLGGRLFEKRNEPKDASFRKKILILTMIFNLGVLFFVKYVKPIYGAFSGKTPPELDKIPFFDSIIIPLGISYYTLQILSYLLDVYWGRQKAETNYGKLLLFTCYFPQMIQGPISRYGALSAEFFKEHRFKLHNLKFGLQLMLWGFFKKMVIADKVGPYVQRIFFSHKEPYGLTVVLGLIFYGIQLYCDFSGGIDVIRGVSECFDVKLAENFRQPYFSRSLGEFWRRWHITLGSWMKDYVFYPLSLSRPMAKFKKSLKKKVSRVTVNRIQIAICDIVVFLLVGYWHGAESIYWAWGLYNGIILAISALLTDVYAGWRKKLGVDPKRKLWDNLFIARTLVIVTVGWIFDCSKTALGSLNLLKNAFIISKTSFEPIVLNLVDWVEIAELIIFCAILFKVSRMKERGVVVREKIEALPFAVQVIIWVGMIQLVACFGRSSGEVGFMYANF